MTMTVDKLLREGTVQILPAGQLDTKLRTGKKLRIKLGVDPTAPDLHLGHAVVLRKLREFQECGHEIIFLIGDFTARIGDPTGKSKTRPVLDESAIAHNMRTYFEQVKRFIDFADDDQSNTVGGAQIRYNSQWLSEMSFADVVRLLGKVTVARVLEREDFHERLAQKQAISMHELLYPLMQGYDSVALEADIEIGGTDQTFNMLMGRHLQEQYGQEPQVVMTMPLLEGLDGVQKMSKSLGNYIGLYEAPKDAYGKLMSISDALMWRYYELLLRMTQDELEPKKEAVAIGKLRAIDVKKEMAHGVIAAFWSPEQATEAQSYFESIFQEKDYQQAQEVLISSEIPYEVWVVDLLKKVGALRSSSEAKRLIEGGAVQLEGQQIRDFKEVILWKTGDILKIGKHRIYKLL